MASMKGGGMSPLPNNLEKTIIYYVALKIFIVLSVKFFFLPGVYFL